MLYKNLPIPCTDFEKGTRILAYILKKIIWSYLECTKNLYKTINRTFTKKWALGHLKSKHKNCFGCGGKIN